jgi:cell shape-determining protein MreD
MTYLYHIVVGVCLVVFQTTVLPYLPFSSNFYDLLVPFIVYLGSYRSIRESLPIALFLGFLVDSFSGGFFGVYITAYVWLTISIRWLSTLIQLENYILLPLVVVIGVLLENLILFFAIMIANSNFQFSTSILGVIVIQVFWVICTGPFLLISFAKMFSFLKIEQT